MEVQNSLKENIESMTGMVTLRDIKIVALKVASAKKGEVGIDIEEELELKMLPCRKGWKN